MIRDTQNRHLMRGGPRTAHRAQPLAVWLAFALTFAVTLPHPSAATPCVQDTDCDDGLACNGLETCDTGGEMCVAGTALDCSAQADQCNDAACADPGGTCVVTPKINGFGCIDDDICTTNSTCIDGVCVGSLGADTDGDGFCDAAEVQAQCNPEDGAEIPLQPNVYSGSKGATPGEILLTYRAPSDRDVKLASDPSCATAGVCNLVTFLCTSGKISDPCSVDSDCDQPARTCRIVINYGGPPNLQLLEASFKASRQPRVDMLPAFRPITPGCTRKVDISLPIGFRRGAIKLKASGTQSGRVKKDRDRIKFRE